MTFTLLDSVTPSAFGRLASTSSDALAGYDDGHFNDIGQIERAYPGHRHLAIAVFAQDNGDCLDIETGDARPQDAPGWLRRQHARGIARPWLYANESTWPEVHAWLSRAGIARREFVKWVAVYDGQPTLRDDWEAHQYTDHWEGRNVDASVCQDDVFDLLRPPPRPKRKPRRKRRYPLRRVVTHVHPKVKAATGGASVAAWLPAVLHSLGGHLSAWETGLIGAVLAAVLGYLTPGSRK